MAFRKSSSCSTTSCIEVDTEFRKSSFCSTNSCVEVGMAFRKSSFSASSHCVEVELNHKCQLNECVALRDSKNPEREPLVFEDAVWAAFTEDIKAGAFD